MTNPAYNVYDELKKLYTYATSVINENEGNKAIFERTKLELKLTSNYAENIDDTFRNGRYDSLPLVVARGYVYEYDNLGHHTKLKTRKDLKESGTTVPQEASLKRKRSIDDDISPNNSEKVNDLKRNTEIIQTLLGSSDSSKRSIGWGDSAILRQPALESSPSSNKASMDRSTSQCNEFLNQNKLEEYGSQVQPQKNKMIPLPQGKPQIIPTTRKSLVIDNEPLDKQSRSTTPKFAAPISIASSNTALTKISSNPNKETSTGTLASKAHVESLKKHTKGIIVDASAIPAIENSLEPTFPLVENPRANASNNTYSANNVNKERHSKRQSKLSPSKINTTNTVRHDVEEGNTLTQRKANNTSNNFTEPNSHRVTHQSNIQHSNISTINALESNFNQTSSSCDKNNIVSSTADFHTSDLASTSQESSANNGEKSSDGTTEYIQHFSEPIESIPENYMATVMPPNTDQGSNVHLTKRIYQEPEIRVKEEDVKYISVSNNGPQRTINNNVTAPGIILENSQEIYPSLYHYNASQRTYQTVQALSVHHPQHIENTSSTDLVNSQTGRVPKSLKRLGDLIKKYKLDE
ncbi:hypothetical protein TBLA_0A04120 [Henningerozyma blattae CBS 6284]|uniref:Uncharacterized protein n=1 Tax=Henningerozyma blattae (strain ATCC 34711 / CBS 6284 / DSM 70876 / NBRC 10599 / NRRL Y-10934 / UCD 77-7) TaxID=1071380 RepID=I2GVQ6_HENB6|nr:hypothetical protein TBLA_0A04120 [Tetrapisispora blattae CBS 6284]CCH58208.1 hypothetical protein TBLA_0A04120 [Tetrapisispora blattae CBS 6284]